MEISVAYLLMQMPVPSEVFLSVEINALIRAGVDVKVFCLKGPHPNQKKLVTDQGLLQVAIYNFPYLFSGRAWQDMAYWLRRNPGMLWHMFAVITYACWRRPVVWIKSLIVLPKSFSIARHIERDQIGIVHAAWGHYPAVTAYLIKHLMPQVQFTLALGAYDRVMRHPMTVVAAEHAACILTQSEASAYLIKNEWPKPSKPVFVIARGIDLETVRSYSRASERMPGLIATVGRLIEVKGHQYVVRAFARVHRVIPHSRLMIFGEGIYRRKLEHLISRLRLQDSIEFVGHLSHPELFNRISQSSVFVLASESKADNIPNSLKEAIGIGIPVITTRTTGTVELVLDGVTGCIVPMGDVGAIADAIIRVLDDQEFASRLARQAAKHLEGKFDIKKTTQQRKRLYCELASVADQLAKFPRSSIVQIA